MQLDDAAIGPIDIVNCPIDISASEDIIVQTLLGEYMKNTVDFANQMDDIWQKIPEYRQQDMLEALHKQARHTITEMLKLVIGMEHDSLETFITDIKKGEKSIQAKVVFPLTENKQTELFMAANTRVMIVLCDPEDYRQCTPISADLDQPGLPL